MPWTQFRLQLRSTRIDAAGTGAVPVDRVGGNAARRRWSCRRSSARPESPKHVPPVWALFESSNEKSPVKPVLICSSCGVATIRTSQRLVLPRRGVRECLLQAVADRGEPCLRARLERLQLVQRRQLAVRAHRHRRVEDDDAEVVDVERVRVVVRDACTACRRPGPSVGSRWRGSPTRRPTGTRSRRAPRGTRCSDRPSGRPSPRAACRCTARAERPLRPARPSAPRTDGRCHRARRPSRLLPGRRPRAPLPAQRQPESISSSCCPLSLSRTALRGAGPQGAAV